MILLRYRTIVPHSPHPSTALSANLVLQDTVERTHVADGYSDAYRGVFVIRGENVVLLGEIVS
ncbi:hypothetical protein BDK51DRAFT_24783, partial [Blyttiomyces helicus]